MFYLLVYDININKEEPKSKNKLAKVAKICENYGTRVQNSVFELNLHKKDIILLKNKLEKLIDVEIDSIRIYELGKNYQNKIEIIGKKENIENILDDGFFI